MLNRVGFTGTVTAISTSAKEAPWTQVITLDVGAPLSFSAAHSCLNQEKQVRVPHFLSFPTTSAEIGDVLYVEGFQSNSKEIIASMLAPGADAVR